MYLYSLNNTRKTTLCYESAMQINTSSVLPTEEGCVRGGLGQYISCYGEKRHVDTDKSCVSPRAPALHSMSCSSPIGYLLDHNHSNTIIPSAPLPPSPLLAKNPVRPPLNLLRNPQNKPRP